MAIVAAASPSLFAQWKSYPTAGVPRLPNGEPNLTAPAPRTADGKPDFSGLWRGGRRAAGDAWRSACRPGRSTRRSAPGDVSRRRARIQGGSAAHTLGRGAAEEAEGRQQQRQSRGPLPADGHHAVSHAGRAAQVRPDPGLIVILYEASSGIRQIFTDGRPLPDNDPQPWWYGYSTGKWDGDTLVVETTGFRDDGWLDIWGSPLTTTGK